MPNCCTISSTGRYSPNPTPLPSCRGHFDVPDDGEYDVEPGAEISTTFRPLRTTVPILRLDREGFVERILETAPVKPPNYKRIIEINRGRAAFEADEAIELELGPNRCADE